MDRLNDFTNINAQTIVRAAERFGTPQYLYDESLVRERCREFLDMPNAFGHTVRYAMKANPNRSLLKIINGMGLHIDASSLNEVLRALAAGVPCGNIMLTTQEVYTGGEMGKIRDLLPRGMKYNVCSLRQLHEIGDFAAEYSIKLGIRVHPGAGSGESATRNTGDDYSCFGVHKKDWPKALSYAQRRGIKFTHVHVHIGSGGDPEMWRQNIDTELAIIEEYFPDAVSVGFGGGFREARMPDEKAADPVALVRYATERIEDFYRRTGRKLHMEIEPGTYIVANSGYIVTRVLDKKSTGEFNFIINDGGMELNARPLMYGSRHPIYIVSTDGELLSSEFSNGKNCDYETVVAGKCCESSDMQTLDKSGMVYARKMTQPEIGDLCVICGVGAYCSSMSPFNYNSHVQAPEVLCTESGELRLIRRRQTTEQMMENEV